MLLPPKCFFLARVRGGWGCDPPPSPALPVRLPACPPLPCGPPRPRVDDSEIARRLLAHTFGLLPSPPVVRTFGGTAREVEAFLAEAPLAADVVILDQHLAGRLVRHHGSLPFAVVGLEGSAGGLRLSPPRNQCLSRGDFEHSKKAKRRGEDAMVFSGLPASDAKKN